MAEQANPNFIRNHTVDLKQVRLDVYRLAGYLEASYPIALMRDRASDEHEFFVETLEREFFCDEVSRILLQSAIILRMLDDESEADLEERNPFHCGTLEHGEKEENLSLREACNKIIHTRQINFDSELVDAAKSGNANIRYYRPYVYLYGRKRKKEWKATIELHRFLNHAARLLRARSLAEFMEWESKYGRT